MTRNLLTLRSSPLEGRTSYVINVHIRENGTIAQSVRRYSDAGITCYDIVGSGTESRDHGPAGLTAVQ